VGTLLDAYALVAFLEDEAAADDVERLLHGRDAAIPAVNLAEAGQRVLRHGRVDASELQQLIGSMPVAIIPYSEAHAWRTARLRAQYYERGRSEVSLADCCLVAVATAADRVATADPAVLRMAASEGIPTIALPRP
jgi:PIN domain nuclease of toxin-antitoxin system